MQNNRTNEKPKAEVRLSPNEKPLSVSLISDEISEKENRQHFLEILTLIKNYYAKQSFSYEQRFGQPDSRIETLKLHLNEIQSKVKQTRTAGYIGNDDKLKLAN